MSNGWMPFGRAVSLVKEKSADRDFRIGLEAIEPKTGRLVDSPVTDYKGEGSAFEPGDLLFGKLRPYLAKAWLADSPGAAVGDFHVYRPNLSKVVPEYLRYALLSRAFLDPVESSVFGAKMPRANWDFIRNVEVFLPALSDQRAIAEYLDLEIGGIDTLIAEQQRLVEMLRERRAAVLQRAVRQGVCGERKLVDSGDPVVGSIPEAWSLTTVRRLADSLDSRRVPLSSEERTGRKGPYPYYGATAVIDSVDEYLFDEPLALVAEDGFGLLLRSKPIAVAVEGRIWVNNHAHVLRPKQVPHTLLAARIEAESLVPYISGSRQPKLTADALMGMRISFPPPEEWDEIVSYLEEQTTRIDSLIIESERLIELSQERRSALITAAVTGQIDVCQEA
ncbi:restriction endonuclease subunit S [Streptomyces sp. NPDC101227]|uniref:restriction endonuclease subunit S n=1 Tax=Streptomyces sp. NPDC101227 TaxID=3366136 RepID=UPI00381E414B